MSEQPPVPVQRARSSIRTRAAVRTALLTAGVIFATGSVFFVQVKSSLEQQLAKRGRALAKSIGVTSELALFSGRGQDAAEAIDPFFRGDEEILYVLLLDKDERLILSRIRPGLKNLSPAQLVRIHRSMGVGPLEVHQHLPISKGDILGFTEVVKVRRRGVKVPPPLSPEKPPAVRPFAGDGGAGAAAAAVDGGKAPSRDGGAARPRDGGLAAAASQRSDGGRTDRGARDGGGGAALGLPGASKAADAEEAALGGGAAPASPKSREVGRVLLGLSEEPLNTRLWTLAKVAFGIGISAVILLLAALFGATRPIFQRIERMVEVAAHISRGDLTQRVDIDTDDELGRLGEALNRISTNLGRMMLRVQAVTSHLTTAVETLSATSVEVVAGAKVQSEAVAKTQSAAEAMNDNLRAIAADVGVLSEAARQSTTAIQVMTALNQEVLQQVVAMTQGVDETASSIEGMARSVREVAQNVEGQSSEAARTSRSMVDMDLAIREAQSAAEESAVLSEAVRQNAEGGAEAVGRVLRGIRRIEKQSVEVLEAMDNLDEKVRSVGMILSLIDEIAEQVNLLSLNAAIIAAQAGEHGKAFAVVADEIKELADRTSASTREIAELVKSMQIESGNATHAVEQAARNIEGGVALSAQAEEALSKIVESAARGAAMAQAIARATVDQARGSEVVTDSSRRIAEAVGQVAAATSQQARSSELITRSAQKMREINQSVDGTCNAEAQAADEVSKALERIGKMVESLHVAHRTQSRSAEDVHEAMQNIRRVTEGHLEAMATLEQAIEGLSAQAKALHTEVERFTVS